MSGFLQAAQPVKIQFKLDKKSSLSNLIFQTRDFKTQVQINRGRLIYKDKIAYYVLQFDIYSSEITEATFDVN